MSSLTSVELNFLVFRYLHESGFTHSAFTLGYEAGINKSNIDGNMVPPGALIKFVQKGLQYMEMEANLSSSEVDIDEDFSFFQPLDLISKDVKELQDMLREKKRKERDREKERDRSKENDKEVEREHEVDRNRAKEKDRHEKQKEREREREKMEREKEREREKIEREKEREREKKERETFEREKDRLKLEREREIEREREREKIEREKSHEKQLGDGDRKMVIDQADKENAWDEERGRSTGAFEKLLQEDKLYEEYFLEDDEKTKQKRLGPPRLSDWEEVIRLVKFLKIFYNCTLTFSASTSVTSSEAYKNIVNIERSLISKCRSSNEEIRKQGHIMRDKFEKYWDGLLNMNPLVIVASVFDPRNKMQFASLCIEQLYGKDTIEFRKLTGLVTSVMRELYDEYSSRLSKPVEVQEPEASQQTHPVPDLADDDDDDDDCEAVELLYNKLKRSRGPEDGFSELDIYLSEKTEDRVESSLGFPYDVLSWWKCNCQKYPILSALAKDVLVIQVSFVASESVFSTSGRVLDSYRSSLTPYMIEVLILTQQWLRCSFKAEAEIASIMQMMEDVAFFDSRNAQKLE